MSDLPDLNHPAETDPRAVRAWRDMWLKPRAVMVARLADKRGWGDALPAFLAGMALVLQMAGRLPAEMFTKQGQPVPGLVDWLMMACVLGPLAGSVQVLISGFLLGLFGRAFGARAAAADVRLAVSWSQLPVAASLPVAVLMLSGSFSALQTPLAWLVQGLGLWSLLLLAMSLSEVMRLSFRRAVGVVLCFIATQLGLLLLMAG